MIRISSLQTLPLGILLTVASLAANATIKLPTDFNNNKNKSDFPQEGYYVGFSGGSASPNKFKQALKTGYSYGFHYGYRDDNYRTELALNYISHNIKPVQNSAGANYNLFNIMINAYYDFNFKGVVVPFVGAGVGYLNAYRRGCSRYNEAHCAVLQVSNKFAYQGMAGLGFNFKSRARLDFRYRYLALDHSQNYAENLFELVLNIFIK